jgi:hypothetical protein
LVSDVQLPEEWLKHIIAGRKVQNWLSKKTFEFAVNICKEKLISTQKRTWGYEYLFGW